MVLCLRVVLLFSSAGLIVCNVAQQNSPDAGTRIVQGSKTERIEDVKHHVSLQANKQHFCGGSIIHCRWILTAAHCLKVPNLTASNISAVVGVMDLDLATTSYAIVQIIWHEQYSNDLLSIRNDIGLLKTVEELPQTPNISPIPICEKYIEDGQPLRLNGYGKTSHPGDTTRVLMSMDTTAINWSECLRKLYVPNLMSFQFLPSLVAPPSSSTNICTRNKKGTGACHGDSGGGLLAVGFKPHCIAGVVSWGIPCAQEGKPDMYTRISAFKKWIDSTIEKHTTGKCLK